MDDHRPVELLRDIRLVGRTEIAAPFELGFQRAFRVPFLQQLHRLVIADARERRLHRFQLRDIARRGLQVTPPALQHPRHDRADELLRQLHEPFKFQVRDLRLHHPELGQVAPRLRFFRAKRWAKRIHLAERHCGRFDIQLP